MAANNIFSLDKSDYANIDPRLKLYLHKWHAVQKYKGKTVEFYSDKKGTWEAQIFPYRYFEVIKQPSDDNYKPGGEEDEIVLCLWAGWPGYDDEIDIRLHLRGSDVKCKVNKVSAEILNTGGAPIELYHNRKKICDFNHNKWWKKDKVWIEKL